MISRKVARELHLRPCAWNNLGNRGCNGELGFDPVELWVMGPPCGLKIGAVTSRTGTIARHVRGYPVSYMSATSSVPRAWDEENHFPAH